MWCGFDEMMRTGIDVYAEGVARAIKTKAESCGIPVAHQLANERVELETLEKLIDERLNKSIDDPATILQLRAFGGLVSVARFLIEKNRQSNKSAKSEMSFSSDAKALGSLIEEFDKFFMTLPQEDGHPKNAAVTLDVIIPVAKNQLDDSSERITSPIGFHQESLA